MTQTWDIGGGGGTSYPFDTIGDYVKGHVVGYEPGIPQTDPKTGERKTFSDGTPMLMARVDLEVIDSSGAADPGDPVSVYLKGAKKPVDPANGVGSTQAAVAHALRQATGGTALAHRGVLTLQYVADQPDAPRGQTPAKWYRAWYEGPAFNVVAPDPTQPAAGTASTSAPPPPGTPSGPAPTTPPGAPTPAGNAHSPGPANHAAAPTPATAATANGSSDTDLLNTLEEYDPRIRDLRSRGIPDPAIRQALKL
jgi:hypothetical protein